MLYEIFLSDNFSKLKLPKNENRGIEIIEEDNNVPILPQPQVQQFVPNPYQYQPMMLPQPVFGPNPMNQFVQYPQNFVQPPILQPQVPMIQPQFQQQVQSIPYQQVPQQLVPQVPQQIQPSVIPQPQPQPQQNVPNGSDENVDVNGNVNNPVDSTSSQVGNDVDENGNPNDTNMAADGEADVDSMNGEIPEEEGEDVAAEGEGGEMEGDVDENGNPIPAVDADGNPVASTGENGSSLNNLQSVILFRRLINLKAIAEKNVQMYSDNQEYQDLIYLLNIAIQFYDTVKSNHIEALISKIGSYFNYKP